MIISEKSIRSATKGDLNQLANLIHFEPYVHRHLDYRPPLDWIEKNPFLVLDDEGKIIAALACAPDPPGVVWIRLFACFALSSPSNAWSILWKEALNQLVELRVQYIAAIALYAWFKAILRQSGFEQTNSIVMLQRNTTFTPNLQPSQDIKIRTMAISDLTRVHEIDQEAFTPMWVNTIPLLEITFHQAMVATVAEFQGKIVGYQLSTATPVGCHLARLAVETQYQGKGFGYSLLCDLIHQLKPSAVRFISVNTQEDNLASLALYRKAGFQLTGENYPIYQLLPT